MEVEEQSLEGAFAGSELQSLLVFIWSLPSCVFSLVPTVEPCSSRSFDRRMPQAWPSLSPIFRTTAVRVYGHAMANPDSGLDPCPEQFLSSFFHTFYKKQGFTVQQKKWDLLFLRHSSALNGCTMVCLYWLQLILTWAVCNILVLQAMLWWIILVLDPIPLLISFVILDHLISSTIFLRSMSYIEV